MPKRSAEKKLEYYKKKISKIEEKVRKNNYNEEELNQDENREYDGEIYPVEFDGSIGEEIEIETTPNEVTVSQNEGTLILEEPKNNEEPLKNLEPSPTEDTLDPELLLALGACTSDTPEFGDAIHTNLASLWLPLLKKGMNKDDKNKIFKEYLPPENCKLIRAPQLNAEISSAVSDVARSRDKKILDFQQQLGTGITAISKGMSVLLSKGDNKIQALKFTSDGCRILSDLHHLLTKDRTKLIMPSLDKNCMHVIKDSERDDMLFGSSLSDKIKASKAIERQGQQIRNTSRYNTSAGPSSYNIRPIQGNLMGPPRYPSNRGLRGGLRKPTVNAAPRRQYYPQIQSKNIQSKPRASSARK